LGGKFLGEHNEPRLSERSDGCPSGGVSHGGLNPSVNLSVLLEMARQEIEVGDTCAVSGRDRFDPDFGDERCGANDALEFINALLCHEELLGRA
jgi:hypothetical protein